MALARSRRPRFEQLEDRLCPALALRFFNGTLTLSGSPVGVAGELLVTDVGAGLNVMDDTTDFGTYAVTGDLRLNLTNYAKPVSVDLGGDTFDGNISLTLGIGDLAFGLNPVSIYNGETGGNVTIRGGSGDEVINLGADSSATPDPLEVGGSVYFTGKKGLGGLGIAGDSVTLHEGSRVNGSVILTYADTVNIGPQMTTGAEVAGNVVVNSTGGPLPLTMDMVGEVRGNVTVVGTNLVDDLELGDSAGNPAVIDGNLTVVFGENTGAGITPNLRIFSAGEVQGDLNYTGGNGPDEILFESDGVTGPGATVFGSVSLYLGGGDNVFEMQQVVVGLPATILGDLNVTALGGVDDIDLDGFIGGNVTLNLGAGDNLVDLSADAVVGGARMQVYTGSGADEVNIDGLQGFALIVNTGAGLDTVAFGATATVGAATIDFGVDFDVDVWTPPAVIAFPLLLLNFP